MEGDAGSAPAPGGSRNGSMGIGADHVEDLEVLGLLRRAQDDAVAGGRFHQRARQRRIQLGRGTVSPGPPRGVARGTPLPHSAAGARQMSRLRMTAQAPSDKRGVASAPVRSAKISSEDLRAGNPSDAIGG